MRDVATTTAAIRAIVQATQDDPGFDELLEHARAAVARAFAFERVAFARYYASMDEVATVAFDGDLPAHLKARLPLADVPALRQAIATQETAHVANARDGALPLDLVAAYGMTSLACVPVFSSGRCLGFLVADRGGAPFSLDESDRAALDLVGVVIGTMLEKVLLREEMQRLDSMKSEFIAIASHELRTPLTSVYGISATLHERGDELDRETLHELRRTLHDQTQRLRELVDQLLDLSRFDVASVAVSPEPIELLPKLEQLVALTAGEDAVNVEVEAGVEASVDPIALDRIVSNLLSNALRYGSPPVTVRASAGDAELRLVVEDRGAGVDDAFVARLFDRFSRSHTSGEKAGGTGLGLAIARAYARAHGGDLTYEHAEPRGARFVLALPNAPAPPDAAADTFAPPVRRGDPVTARIAPVVVRVSPPDAAAAMRDLLDDYHAKLVSADRIEIEPIDAVRRGTVIYRVVQASHTIADRFPAADMRLVAEDGNRWRLPPPAI